MKKLIVILAAVFLMLIIAGAAYIFLVMPRLNPVQAQQPADGSEAEADAAPAPKKGKEPVMIKYEMESFVANVKESNRLFKVTVIVSCVDEKKVEETALLDEKLEAIRDYLVSVFRSKTEEELRSDDAMAKLREQIVEELHTKFELPFVDTVYFKDFVIQ